MVTIGLAAVKKKANARIGIFLLCIDWLSALRGCICTDAQFVSQNSLVGCLFVMSEGVG